MWTSSDKIFTIHGLILYRLSLKPWASIIVPKLFFQRLQHGMQMDPSLDTCYPLLIQDNSHFAEIKDLSCEGTVDDRIEIIPYKWRKK